MWFKALIVIFAVGMVYTGFWIVIGILFPNPRLVELPVNSRYAVEYFFNDSRPFSISHDSLVRTLDHFISDPNDSTNVVALGLKGVTRVDPTEKLGVYSWWEWKYGKGWRERGTLLGEDK